MPGRDLASLTLSALLQALLRHQPGAHLPWDHHCWDETLGSAVAAHLDHSGSSQIGCAQFKAPESSAQQQSAGAEYRLSQILRVSTGWRQHLRFQQEALLWRCAESHYGSSLESVVAAAVGSFRRRPGLNPLTRVHGSDIGPSAFMALSFVIEQVNTPPSDGTFIHVREQLRSHINYHVLKNLVDAHAVPPELRDTLFSIDLGL